MPNLETWSSADAGKVVGTLDNQGNLTAATHAASGITGATAASGTWARPHRGPGFGDVPQG